MYEIWVSIIMRLAESQCQMNENPSFMKVRALATLDNCLYRAHLGLYLDG